MAKRAGEDLNTCTSTEKNEEQPQKKPKVPECNKLVEELGEIFVCAVCLSLPKTNIYQCVRGHLMCAGCLTHLLADARIRDCNATCPTCHVAISKDLCSRNIVVEKALSEFPAACKYCSKQIPRSQLEVHQDQLCEEREIPCSYSCLGCPWLGALSQLSNHTKECPYPSKHGYEVMEALNGVVKRRLEDLLCHSEIYEILSCENITFNDLQFKPYHSVEDKLFYETSRFVALRNQWVVKAHVNDNQKDPTQSCERHLSYQLVLKTKTDSPISIKYVIVKGPFGDMKVCPKIYCFDFDEDKSEAPYQLLPLCDSAECNKQLAEKVINFRIIMFEVTR